MADFKARIAAMKAERERQAAERGSEMNSHTNTPFPPAEGGSTGLLQPGMASVGALTGSVAAGRRGGDATPPARAETVVKLHVVPAPPPTAAAVGAERGQPGSSSAPVTTGKSRPPSAPPAAVAGDGAPAAASALAANSNEPPAPTSNADDSNKIPFPLPPSTDSMFVGKKPVYHRQPPEPVRVSSAAIVRGFFSNATAAANGAANGAKRERDSNDDAAAHADAQDDTPVEAPAAGAASAPLETPPPAVARTEAGRDVPAADHAASTSKSHQPAVATKISSRGEEPVGRLANDLLPGQRKCRKATDFKRGARLAEGVYGVVYKGADTAAGGATRALKWIKSKWFAESRNGFPDYLLREIDLLHRMKHPNVLAASCMAIVDVDAKSNDPELDEGRGKQVENSLAAPRSLNTMLFMVTEYAGFNLRSEIYRGERMNLAAIKFLLREISRGLHFMHSHGILHRDLKPSNILVDLDNSVKVCDMGLARMIRAREAHLTTAIITLMYRPPELHLGVRDYSSAVDMWSLGCIAAEMILHEPLFVATEDDEHLVRVCEVLGVPAPHCFEGMLSLRHARERLAPVRISPEAADVDANYAVAPSPKDDISAGNARVVCHRLQRRLFEAAPALVNDRDFANLVDVIDRLLQWNPAARLTAGEVLAHPLFHQGCDPDAADITRRRDAYQAEKRRLMAESLAKRQQAATAQLTSNGASSSNAAAAAAGATTTLSADRVVPGSGAAAAMPAADVAPAMAEAAAAAASAALQRSGLPSLSAALNSAAGSAGAVADEDDLLLENIGPAEVGVRHIAVNGDDDDDDGAASSSATPSRRPSPRHTVGK